MAFRPSAFSLSLEKGIQLKTEFYERKEKNVQNVF